jgi:hypothetical protein
MSLVLKGREQEAIAPSGTSRDEDVAAFADVNRDGKSDLQKEIHWLEISLYDLSGKRMKESVGSCIGYMVERLSPGMQTIQ